jgi:hypothetical protein
MIDKLVQHLLEEIAMDGQAGELFFRFPFSLFLFLPSPSSSLSFLAPVKFLSRSAGERGGFLSASRQSAFISRCFSVSSPT